jgi:hypothetical protein
MTRDWNHINNKYIREGELYLSFDFLEQWDEQLAILNKGKEGAPYKYPEALMRFCAVGKAVFGLPYRQQQGFLQALQSFVPLQAVPCYTQLQRRITGLGLDIVDSLADPQDGQIIAIDASGIKLYNSGEWIREKHKKKKPFLKLHVAVNIDTKQAVATRVTEDSVGDSVLGLELMDEAARHGRVEKGLYDGAYDHHVIWNGLHARGIKPLIRLRKNAVVHAEHPVRSQAIKCYKGNEKAWVKATGFGQRWQAETWFSSYKRRFGEACYSTKPENVVKEILFKVMLCNTLIV